MLEVELTAEQWDAPPPDCPRCSNTTYQEFAPPTIGGSNSTRAADYALKIASEDYNVADIQVQRGHGPPKVRYNDSNQPASSWAPRNGALEQAIAIGRQTRLQHGSGLEVLQTGLKNKTIPDLIANSKRLSAKVW
jgi:hypothetical protein